MGQHTNWYKRALWCGPRGRRAVQLARQPLCERCLVHGRTTAATIADHDPPHRGDWTAFVSGPLQSLCKRCHDSDKQSEEVRGYRTDIAVDGWPDDDRHPSNAAPIGGK